jgi:hypothetical protein
MTATDHTAGKRMEKKIYTRLIQKIQDDPLEDFRVKGDDISGFGRGWNSSP